MQELSEGKENREGQSHPSIAATAALFIIRAYKRHISPLVPSSCRYYPTCSDYAMEAISSHGAVYGGLMAIKRILRCNRFFQGGRDPVPQKTFHVKQ